MFCNDTESLVRYRLLSEPELSNLLKTTTLSSGSLQSPICDQQPSKCEPENASTSTSDTDLINEQKSPRLVAVDDNDNRSQNRSNNNFVET